MAVPTHSGEVAELARRLLVLTAGSGPGTLYEDNPPQAASLAAAVRDADAIVSHVEVNEMHGVGVLLRRLFSGQPNIVSIRSADYYGGCQDFGDVALRISHQNMSRDAVFSKVLTAIGQTTVRRVLCVPYFPDDVRTALAVKEIFGVPMCTYIMDDQNVCTEGIPDHLVRELLEKSALRLAISPELSIAYELKYGLRMWYMPPVVSDRLILSHLNPPSVDLRPDHGVIIGNIWSNHWLQLLRETVRSSGVTLTWYSNGEFRGLSCTRDDLIADSIIPREPPSSEELVRILRQERFAVLPSGSLDPHDDRKFIAQLSLPSRLVYLMATALLPVLVLGSPQNAAARFVRQFGIGLAAGYSRCSFQQAVTSIVQPETNLALRRNALAAAGRFSDDGAAEWIWQSLARGEPINRRFEDLMPVEKPDLSHLFGGKRAIGG